MPVHEIIIEFVHDDEAGLDVAELGLINIGRGHDWPWVFGTLTGLSDDEVLHRFKSWPGLSGPEGVWGIIALGLYLVMCQLDAPQPHERALGKRAVLKVDLVGYKDDILRRIRELDG